MITKEELLLNRNAEIISILLILIFLYSIFQNSWLNLFIYKYWLFQNCDFLNYFTYFLIHGWIYHLIFNVIALLSIKDLLRWKFIWEFLWEIIFIWSVSWVIFQYLNQDWWVLVWFSWVFFWILIKILLENYFSENRKYFNWSFVIIILFLNLFLIPFLFPQVSWLWHFLWILTWGLLFLISKIRL